MKILTLGSLLEDDLVMILKSHESLSTALNTISSWGVTNEMEYGIDKCGIPGFEEGAID